MRFNLCQTHWCTGNVFWWDIRRLVDPIEKLVLAHKDPERRPVGGVRNNMHKQTEVDALCIVHCGLEPCDV